jgi:hypothetical protein
MKFWSGTAFIASKKLLFASFAVAAIGLSPVALAETDATAHAETTSALRCLLDPGKNGCGRVFVGSASLAARPWVYQNPNLDFELGALVSSSYAGTETDSNAFIARFLNGRTADLYDVKFRHHEKTFYIAPPGPDGKIHYMLIRGGAPADERRDLFVRGPG